MDLDTRWREVHGLQTLAALKHETAVCDAVRRDESADARTTWTTAPSGDCPMSNNVKPRLSPCWREGIIDRVRHIHHPA